MNLKEYKEWLNKNGKREEKRAYDVANCIVDWHLRRIIYEDLNIEVYPRHWIFTEKERLEFDLLMHLEWRSDRKYRRVIGIEFKESDFRKVVSQAVIRREYVDYMWIATRNIVPNVESLILLLDSGIGWILWERDFIKILIPAKYHRGSIKYLIEHLAKVEVDRVVRELVEEAKVSASIRNLFDFFGGGEDEQ
jgi:hypothetical protein